MWKPGIEWIRVTSETKTKDEERIFIKKGNQNIIILKTNGRLKDRRGKSQKRFPFSGRWIRNLHQKGPTDDKNVRNPLTFTLESVSKGCRSLILVPLNYVYLFFWTHFSTFKPFRRLPSFFSSTDSVRPVPYLGSGRLRRIAFTHHKTLVSQHLKKGRRILILSLIYTPLHRSFSLSYKFTKRNVRSDTDKGIGP